MRTKLMTVAAFFSPRVATNDSRFYDGKGSYSGRATTSGQSTRFYDVRGNYVGINAK